MSLTPAEVHDVAFSKPPIGMQGYHEDEVDAFLDLVEAELARLIADNDDLRSRAEQLVEQQSATQGETGSAPRRPQPPPLVATSLPPMLDQAAPEGDHHAHAAKVLGLAQEMADRLTGEANTEAERMLSQARAQADQLLCDAKAKIDDLITEARTRAETLISNARTRAETQERESRDRVTSLQRQTARQHSEAIVALSQEKNTLEDKIDQLRTQEREYRTHLETYLTQLHQLHEDKPLHQQPQYQYPTDQASQHSNQAHTPEIGSP
jgi:DivIVA domain-containing protein